MTTNKNSRARRKAVFDGLGIIQPLLKLSVPRAKLNRQINPGIIDAIGAPVDNTHRISCFILKGVGHECALYLWVAIPLKIREARVCR